MNKDVKKVRESIARRKGNRKKVNTDTSLHQVQPTFPQEDEKHGFYPAIPKSIETNNQKDKFITNMVLKGILAVLLFFGVAILLQTNNHLLSKPATWLGNMMTTEFPFARVNNWYQDAFGDPMAFMKDSEDVEYDSSKTLALPVTGEIAESFQANGSGIMISPKQKSTVTTLRKGIVVFAGNDRDTGKTVMVQHTDGSVSTYGNLNKLDVHIYQFVDRNDKIGDFVPNNDQPSVYFSIKKDHKFINPVKAVKVNDTP